MKKKNGQLIGKCSLMVIIIRWKVPVSDIRGKLCLEHDVIKLSCVGYQNGKIVEKR